MARLNGDDEIGVVALDSAILVHHEFVITGSKYVLPLRQAEASARNTVDVLTVEENLEGGLSVYPYVSSPSSVRREEGMTFAFGQRVKILRVLSSLLPHDEINANVGLIERNETEFYFRSVQ